jgi:lysophospholipase L1-like esterase
MTRRFIAPPLLLFAVLGGYVFASLVTGDHGPSNDAIFNIGKITPAHAQIVGCGGGMISGGCGGGGGITTPNFTANAGLPHWRSCLNSTNYSACNTPGHPTIAVIGESTPGGGICLYGLTSATSERSCAWPSQLAAALRNPYGLNARPSSVAGSSNIGLMAAVQNNDTRIVTAGAWTVIGGSSTAPAGCVAATTCSMGAGVFNDATLNDAFEFLPTDATFYPSSSPILTDTLDIYTLGGSTNFGTITVDVGGAALATIVPTGSGAGHYFKTTATTGVSPANNTWNVKITNGSSFGGFWDAIVARNSTVNEIEIINGGWAGATVGNWTCCISADTGSPLPLQTLEAMTPDLTLIQLQGNDQGQGTSIANYESGLTTMVQAAKTTGDVMIVTSQVQQPTSACTNGPSSECTYDYQQSFTTAEYTVASAQNVPIFDFFKGQCGTVTGTGTSSLCNITPIVGGSSTSIASGWPLNINLGWNGGSYDGAAANADHESALAYNAALVRPLADIITHP